jgi:hypothetical protein
VSDPAPHSHPHDVGTGPERALLLTEMRRSDDRTALGKAGSVPVRRLRERSRCERCGNCRRFAGKEPVTALCEMSMTLRPHLVVLENAKGVSTCEKPLF